MKNSKMERNSLRTRTQQNESTQNETQGVFFNNAAHRYSEILPYQVRQFRQLYASVRGVVRLRKIR